MTPQQRAYMQFIANKGKKTQQQTEQYRADMNKVEPKKETSFEEWKASRVPKLAIGGQGPRNWDQDALNATMSTMHEKTTGGNDPEDMLRTMTERHTPEHMETLIPRERDRVQAKMADLVKKQSINQWINSNLTNYVKKHMASPADPVRKLAEEGILHLPIDDYPVMRSSADRHREQHGGERLGKSQAAMQWEDLADKAINPKSIEHLAKSGYSLEPWMEKAPKDTQIFSPSYSHFDKSYLGFDHIIDVLKEDLAEGRIRPEQLNKISMEQAVRRVHQYDQEKAKAMREAAIRQTEGMPVVKEYDTGHKWIELAPPQIDKLPEGWSIKESNGTPFLENPKGENIGRLDEDNLEGHAKWSVQRELLDNALKYEGDTMGHCVGGYGEKVQEGKSRIYSLRDAKGEPHVTIETAPADLARAFGALPEEERRDIEHHVKTTQFGGAMPGRSNEDAYWKALDDEFIRRHGKPADRIVQIKGKQNAKPKPEYMKMARDFVQSGNWSDIGDYQNAGLIRLHEGADMAKALKAQGKPVPKYVSEKEHADWMASQLGGLKKGGQPNMDTMRLELLSKGGKPKAAPMYSPLDKLAAETPRTKGTAQEFMTEMSKKPGYRAEEVADRKIPLPEGKMTKEQFLAHLKMHGAPKLEEKQYGGSGAEEKYWNKIYDELSSSGDYDGYYFDDDGNFIDRHGDLVEGINDSMDAADYIAKRTSEPETLYEDYQIPGGKNYREVLMKSNQDGPQYESSHWAEDPNVLAHLRMSDRDTPQGKMLHLEELQSDWHQEGRKKGYKGDENLLNQIRSLRSLGDQATPEQREELYSLIKQFDNGVPNAPFKKSWHELALKRALREAAEKGYAGLMITPGQEQADRYSLAKHIDNLDYAVNPDGSIDVVGHKGGKNVFTQHGINPQELDRYVGKDVAQQMMEGIGETKTHHSRFNPEQSRDWNSLSGLQLQVGGEGMKGFYDKIVPNYLNKIGKKHGVKVGQMPVNVDRSNQGFHDLMTRHTGMNLPQWDALSHEERARRTPEILQAAKNQQTNVHHFPMTEEMRQDIMQNGLPMYKRGGALPTKE